MGRVASPTKDVAALIPAPVSVAASENRVFADDQAEKGSLGCALTQHDCVLIKGGRLDTETDTGRTSREEEGRDRGDAPRCPANNQKLGETPGTGSPLWPQEEPTLLSP